MQGKSHLIFGLGTGIISAVVSPSISLIHVPVVGIASLLPDIDSPTSMLGKHVKLIGKLFKHRGFLHTPLFLSLFFLMQNQGLRWSFVLGIASHLFLDMFNTGGIMLLWPLSKRKVRVANMKSGAWGESVIIVLLLLLEVVVMVLLLKNSILLKMCNLRLDDICSHF